MKDSIAILDFGSQYSHLIANRIRRLGVYAEILLPETSISELKKYKGIILSGGPQSVYAEGAPSVDPQIFNIDVPVLGVCYGHQLLSHLLGGEVSPGETKEYGLAKLKVSKKIGIFKGMSSITSVWMSHGDTVTKAPPGFEIVGGTSDCPIAATANVNRKIFSTQFHVEVAHTREGIKILKNFLKTCEVNGDWKISNFLSEKIEQIARQLGDRKVFLLVSGGVDSTVAYTMLAEALGGSRVYGLFVDTGFLRKDEGKRIQKMFKKIGIKNFHVYNAKTAFIKGLKGVTEPEKKRKIIGDLFLKIQAKAIKKLKLDPDHWVLGQGTIYPDTIESAGTKYADKIKTHHNRVPEILKLIEQGKIIEPLAELYKDEVRALGEKLGLPHEAVWKHPFPGPGLAVRILCAKKEILPTNIKIVEQDIADYLKPYKLQGKILPIQSVGVQGDNRTYRNPLVIWGAYHSFEKLEELSTSLTNRFPQINRVCLLLSPEKIINVKITPATLTEKRIKFLQNLDEIVNKFMAYQKIERVIWQFPVVLAPIFINGKKKEALVLRPICSDEAMTANFYKMPSMLLKKLTQKLKKYVSAVMYDVTNKPPGTIEWE